MRRLYLFCKDDAGKKYRGGCCFGLPGFPIDLGVFLFPKRTAVTANMALCGFSRSIFYVGFFFRFLRDSQSFTPRMDALSQCSPIPPYSSRNQ